MRKLLAVLVTCGAVLIAVPSAFAICPSGAPIQHQASYFQCADGKGPVAALWYQLTAPTAATSGTEKILCEAQDGVTCFGNSGVKDDNQVTIETDTGNPGVLGCPQVGTAWQRIVISVQCNDGAGLLVSLGGGMVDLFGAYVVEAAHPSDFSPLIADSATGRPFLNTATNNGDGTTTLNLRFPTSPAVHSECDPGTFGLGSGVCLDGFPAGTHGSIGRVFTSQQLCKDATGADLAPRTDRNAAGLWTPQAAVPDASGNVVITALRPTTQNFCLFVGATTNIAGNESSSISSFVAVGGPGAASPVAVRVRAEQAGGNIRISWSTDIEAGLAGFNILAEGKKGSVQVNSAMIAAKGNGGKASYTELVGRNKFQGNQTVIIESVLTDGTKLRSAPAKF